MNIVILALIFGIILAITHFFSEKISIRHKIWHIRSISFVAGISVTYAFLSLLPEAYESFETQGKFIFIFIVLGFTLVHVAEKYVYKHHIQGHHIQHDLKEIHSIAFFLYYLLLGAILVNLSTIGFIQATLFFIPVLFYAGVGLVSMDKIHHKISKKGVAKFALSLSAIFGVLFAETLLNTGIFFDSLFALVIGAFIYIVLIDFIPREKRGEPVYFVLGVLVYTILISLLIL